MQRPRPTDVDDPGQQRLDAGTLFRRHAAFVANFLVRLGMDRGELEDVVQEVFMIAHRRGGFAPGPARPTTWLADIAIRVAANRRRSHRRARVATDEDTVARKATVEPAQGEAIDARRALDRVQRALDTVDEDKRAVFILYELEGESCEAIAAGLAIPIGTVYSRLFAARRKFESAYDRLCRREAPARLAAEVSP